MRNAKGFTSVELMIALLIIGSVAAVALPNSVAMQDRAKEGALRSNMHQFQLAAEDYGVQHGGYYADNAGPVHDLLPAGGKNFANPFTKSTERDGAWMDMASITYDPFVPGCTTYADTLAFDYAIKAADENAQPLPFVLTSGR